MLRLIARLGTRPSPSLAPRIAPLRALATRSEMAARKLALQQPFPALAADLWTSIETGMRGVLEVNEGLRLHRGPMSVDIVLPDGRKFALSADEASRTVTFVTAKAGTAWTYELTRVASGELLWVHPKDGHSLMEHLSRELVYHCKGYPSF